MKINRHNYEEYFILYMDNELGSDDRRMVENFVVQHPDLKEELDVLLQYKLSPDTDILFPGKEELIRTNGEISVTLSNYGEWLILYTDNELNADQRKEVEIFIATNPLAQSELTLLQRTKLQPDQITFPEKESLHRQEEKERAFPVRWWRMAAAAVLLLGIGLTTAVVINKKSPAGESIAKNTGNGIKKVLQTPVITPVKKEAIPVLESAIADNINQPVAPVMKKVDDNFSAKKNIAIGKVKKAVTIPSPEIMQQQVVANNKDNNKPTNNLPKPVNNPNIIKDNATNNAVASINAPNETIISKQPFTDAPVTKAIPASYNGNNDVTQLEEGGKNKKNRGFFRKLVRTFEKRTNITATDDDRLLVGGLSIKLK